ncbi:MAG: SGNH/GDSL hydrolase family protein [Verrucomicrobiota bacterium]
MTDRRKFLIAGSAGVVAASATLGEASETKLDSGSVILFQGDSITDARRQKNDPQPNHAQSLGYGYPAHISGGILREYADKGVVIHNRGISGNKVPDLDARWQEDCIDLKPDILSILIGVNDIWHMRAGRYDGTAEVYRDGFAALLKKTKEALPGVSLVICEPFVLKCGAVDDTWFPEFEIRRAFAEEVAEKEETIWVPFQKKFDEAVAAGTPPEYWAPDGVHPSVAGHALMAKTWREAVGI